MLTRLLVAFIASLLPLSAAAPASTYFARSRAIDPVIRTAMDANGNTYVTGSSNSDVFLTKLDSALREVYTITWGGDFDEQALGIAVGPNGDVFIAGTTNSANYPVVGGVPAPVSTSSNAFVTRLTPNGGFVYSTLLGGTESDTAVAIAVDSIGNTYVTGWTYSQNFPTTAGAFQTTMLPRNPFAAPAAAFVTKLTPLGQIAYSTFLAGTKTSCNGGSSCIPAIANSSGTAILVDSAGAVFVAGITNSSDFPVTAGAYQQACGCSFRSSGGFLSKLNASGSALLSSTFIPGAQVQFLATDPSGNIAAAGLVATTAPSPGGGVGFPTTSGALHELIPGEYRDATAIAFKIAPQLDRMIFATYLTGAGTAAVGGLATDSQGNLLLSGNATAAGIQATAGAPAIGDGFFGKLNALGTAWLYATRLPAGSAEASLAQTPTGDVLLFGTSGFVSRNPPSGISYALPPIMGIANAAGLSISPLLASGELISIYGSNVGPVQNLGARLDSLGLIATELGGVRVTINGLPAPITFAGPNQINAVVPGMVFNGAALLEVLRDGQRVATMELLVRAPLPEVFRAGVLAGSNPPVYSAAALNEDGTINAATNPARRGSIVTIFASGIPTDYYIKDGSVSTPALNKTLFPIKIFGSTTDILYAGQAPGLVAGVVQVNFRIPLDVQTVGLGTYRLQAGDNVSKSFAIFLTQSF